MSVFLLEAVEEPKSASVSTLIPQSNSKFTDTLAETAEAASLQKHGHDMTQSARFHAPKSMLPAAGPVDQGYPKTTVYCSPLHKVCTMDQGYRMDDRSIATGVVEEILDVEENHVGGGSRAAYIPTTAQEKASIADQGCRPMAGMRDAMKIRNSQDNMPYQVKMAHVLERIKSDTIDEASGAEQNYCSADLQIGNAQNRPEVLDQSSIEDSEHDRSKTKSFVEKPGIEMGMTMSYAMETEIRKRAGGAQDDTHTVSSKPSPKSTEENEDPSIGNLDLYMSSSRPVHEFTKSDGREEEEDLNNMLQLASNLNDAVEDTDAGAEKPRSLPAAHKLPQYLRKGSWSESKLTDTALSLAEEIGDRASPLSDEARDERRRIEASEHYDRQGKVGGVKMYGRRGGDRQARGTWHRHKDHADREERMRRKGLYEGNSAMQYLYCSGHHRRVSNTEFGLPSGGTGGFGGMPETYDARVLGETNWVHGSPPSGMAFRCFPVYLPKSDIVPNMFVIYFASSFEMQSTLCWDGPPPQSDGFCYAISFASGQVYYIHACHVLPPMPAPPF